jgi:hypothetical protein
MPQQIKLKSVIGYDHRAGQFVIGSHDLAGNALVREGDKTYRVDLVKGNKVLASSDNPQVSIQQVNSYLARFGPGAGADNAERAALIAAVMEPIAQVVDYMEMYSIFLVPWQIGDTEDPRIPVEDIVTLAWETHEDSEVLYLRPGFLWTRPDFTRFDTGVEIHWETIAKAGWNVLARQMKRAAEALARKRDEFLHGALINAMLPANVVTVAGGTITKASVDSVLKAAATIGFPMTTALVNPGIMMGMGNFNWTNSTSSAPNPGLLLPPDVANEILRTLMFLDYGGVKWYTNPFAPVTEVLFSGAPANTGYHQTRGDVKSASDMDITEKVDRHAIYDQEHAAFIQNAYNLRQLVITA